MVVLEDVFYNIVLFSERYWSFKEWPIANNMFAGVYLYPRCLIEKFKINTYYSW